MSATCPYCRTPFAADDDVRTCPACATPHHNDCFVENRGCTVFGCVNAPGDEAKIVILLEDLGSDSDSRDHRNGAAPGVIMPPQPLPHEPVAAFPRPAIYISEDKEDFPLAPKRYALPHFTSHAAPPRLAWGVLVLLSVLTFGLFQVVWDLVLAVWLRRVQPQSRAVYYYSMVLILVLLACANVIGARTNDSEVSGMRWFEAGVFVLSLIGRFSMRDSLETFFDEAGCFGLYLSEVMTLFFGSIYFQYHLNQLVKQKQQRHAIA